MDYYNRFVDRYPDVHRLAESTEDEVLKLWQGLGYYSRARNLHLTAKYIAEQLNGVFPEDYNSLLSLKGVGPYTAAAISSFAYRESRPVLDGNVKRFISRLFCIQSPIDIKNTDKILLEILKKMIEYTSPDKFNQAIMEFGALYCKPKTPDCANCIFSENCQAFNQDLVQEIPVKSKRIQKKNRFLYFAVLTDNNNNTLLYKRPESDIWGGLYSFPVLDQFDKPINQISLKSFGFDYSAVQTHRSKVIKHLLTHQTIFAEFIHFQVSALLQKETLIDYIVCPITEINNYALPRLIDLYLSD